jgi:hypothetical protein
MATESQIDALVDQSKIILVGTVLRLGASTVSTYSPTSHTVIVKVNQVIHAPEALGDLTGQRVTVELTTTPGLAVGQQVAFFANGLVYADSLVVQEVGRLDAPAGPAARQAQVAEIAASVGRTPDRHIQRRLQTADVVVTGKIVSSRKVPRPQGQPISEHDADWREAVIDVQGVESGLPMKQVVLFFPASRDIRWRQAPKFSVGQEGVWILHQHATRELSAPGYTALQPSDFHPKSSRAHMRALIQGRK